MNFFETIDGYCERLDASFWAEPVNFLTNGAFLIVSLVLWPRVRGLRGGQLLCGILFVIGLGSALFHSFAQLWAAIADVVPILCFVLVYIYLANRDYWRLSVWQSLGLAAMFVPFAALTIPMFQLVPGLGGSAAYAPVALLIAMYAVLLRRSLPEVAVGLAIGAAILVVSIALRSVDLPLCHHLPFGTHFMWHLLNAVMLGWMIEVYRRHMLADQLAGR